MKRFLLFALGLGVLLYGGLARADFTVIPSPVEVTTQRGTVFTQTIQLTAITATETISAVSVSGTGFALTVDACSNRTLPVGQTCAVTVTFSPQEDGVFTGSLNVSSNPTASFSVSLKGTATGLISFSPASVAFGAVNIGTTATKEITVTNLTGWPITFSPPTVAATNGDYSVGGGTCLDLPSVPVNATCTLVVSFKPVVVASTTANISVPFATPSYRASYSLSVSGTGGATPSLSGGIFYVNTTNLWFGDQEVGTVSPPQRVTITNIYTDANGAQQPIFLNPIISGSASYIVTATTCRSLLAYGDTCSIDFAFRPILAGIAQTSLGVTASYANDKTAAQSIFVSGVGTGSRVEGPAIGLSTVALNFGQVPVGSSSNAKKVVLTNVGTDVMVISSIGLGKPQETDYAIQVDNCPSQLPPGQSCDLYVIFTPQSAGGRVNSLVVSEYSRNLVASVSLSGIGVAQPAAGLDISIKFHQFADQVVGVPSRPIRLILTNVGLSDLHFTGLIPTGDFSILATTCTTGGVTNPQLVIDSQGVASPQVLGTLPPGNACTMDMTFSPQSLLGYLPPDSLCPSYGCQPLFENGLRIGELAIFSDAPVSPDKVYLQGGVNTTFYRSDIDGIFNWAETARPDLFYPHAASQTAPGYFYRSYANGTRFLAFSDYQLLYLGPEYYYQILNLGNIWYWFNAVGTSY